LRYPGRVCYGKAKIPPTRIEDPTVSKNRTVQEYVVEGMTCEHCVLSVTEEVSEVAGVEGVEVDLASGRLVVSGEATDESVREAVAEAGYSVKE
jgi:copper chaperone